MTGGTPCPYRLVRPLREGPAVAVFEALDARGSPAVVKLARPGAAEADPLGARRFEREIALCRMLRHPGLATVLDHGSGWIAFERLDASLRDEAMRKRFATPAAARPLLAQVAATLAYLHARGVVHRDVKPAHVMLRGDEPVLVDLGVAGLVADDPLEGAEIVGSPAWMAPEQAAGAPPAPAADIWALCAVAAWLLTGVPPFSRAADAVLAARRRGDRPTFRLSELAEGDTGLVALIEAGLGEADQRPRAADIVAMLRA